MFYQVLLNDEAIAVAVTATTAAVTEPGWLPLASYDASLIGQRWTGAAWEAVATPQPSLTQLAFLRRFTAEERIASRASVDPVVQDFLHLLGLAQEIRLDDADTVAGVNYLESLGLLAEGRAAEVLA